ncbi:MAG: hypothetical protein AAB500_01615 [Patescibacteria group bacterium]
MITNQKEPIVIEGGCSYCGDAAINHTLAYWSSLFFDPFEEHMVRTAYHSPKFLKNFVDWLAIFFLNLLAFFGIVKFSSDLGRAKSFRSRVIWEEARRRGIQMEQVIIFGKPIDYYRALIGGKYIYFESLPIPPEHLDFRRNWDDKSILKDELARHSVPTPKYKMVRGNLEQLWHGLEKPLIVKPKLGSRGRHTFTGINMLEDFKNAVKISGEISPYLVAEEHIAGDVCRATFVSGKLAGFYRGRAPSVTGDGKKNIAELIKEKDRIRPERVEKVRRGKELESHLARQGYGLDDVLSEGKMVTLSHRIGRLFGGTTREMIGELHPSFIPIFRRAAEITGLAVVGFDAVIPDPTASADSQRWGIIEANTLPFIDLHYYALEGKPRNIAGMIWNLWK